MDPKFIEVLRQNNIKNLTNCITAKLVRDMTDSDQFDTHYFITNDNELDGNEFEEVFYIF